MFSRTLRPISRSLANGATRRYASSSSSSSSAGPSVHRNRNFVILGTTAFVLAGYASSRSSIQNESRVKKPALEQESLKTPVNADDPVSAPSEVSSAATKNRGASTSSKEGKSKSGKKADGPSSSTSAKKDGGDTALAAAPAAREVIEEKSAEAKETMQEGAPESQGAFNEETGEINWSRRRPRTTAEIRDCPCLGGMADGPCGEEFKAAFSCFVFSDKEPKGIDCVEKFQAMQNCFREHPDIYGEEIDDLEDDGAAPREGGDAVPIPSESKETSQ